MIKFDCCSKSMAGELKAFIERQGFKAKVMGSAVLSDFPDTHKGCLTNAMIRVVAPNEGDLKIDLNS